MVRETERLCACCLLPASTHPPLCLFPRAHRTLECALLEVCPGRQGSMFYSDDTHVFSYISKVADANARGFSRCYWYAHTHMHSHTRTQACMCSLTHP